MPEKRIDTNLKRVLQLCAEMLNLANDGDKFRQDTGCGVVYGTLRDMAYKVRHLAQNELNTHTGKSKQKKKS